ncbi:MAG TPA: PorV/PorQ family protein [Caldithrix abyssi]|uniref:PorV/PorQ family protein n=1 Tax=Caldithrix abyssi TaxID=187145 RepID=A0A7V4WVH2_CALAY|nr:PorV/PorQ family protein [Caldithrix abyssi]
MIKLNKRYGVVITLVLLLIVSLPLYAGDKARIGTAAGVQVQQPVSARDLAMGGANIVYTSGVDALYWNPAGLSEMSSGFMGTFTRNTIFNDINVNYLGLGIDMGSLGVLGFDIKSFDFGDIPLTTIQDMDGSSGATFSPTWSTMGLTYANKLTNSIQVGVKAKMIYESIPRVTGTAFAFDLGIQYKNLAGIDGVSFAVLLKNIGTNMQYQGSGLTQKVTTSDGVVKYYNVEASSDQLPAYLEIGLAYKATVADKNDVILTGVFQNNNVENDAMKFGAEYNYDNMIALRAGYVYTMNTATDFTPLYTFTLGAGVNFDLGGVVLGVDYAFRNSEFFDANNMFTLKLGF